VKTIVATSPLRTLVLLAFVLSSAVAAFAGPGYPPQVWLELRPWLPRSKSGSNFGPGYPAPKSGSNAAAVETIAFVPATQRQIRLELRPWLSRS